VRFQPTFLNECPGTNVIKLFTWVIY